jgi:integrase
MQLTKNQRVNLTRARIDKLDPPTDRDRVYHYDADTDGLCLCVTQTGRKTWYWYGRSGGRPQRVRLGRWPALGVKDARVAARAHGVKAVQGVDLLAERRKQTGDITLATAFERFKAEPSRRTKRPKSPRTLQGYKQQFDLYLKPWHGRRLGAIDRGEVRRWHNDLTTRSGPYAANRALALLKAVYRIAASRFNYDGTDPTAGVEMNAERSIIRRLSGDELRRLLDALGPEVEPNQDAADVIRLALWTGARKSNVLAMRWADIDLDGRLWTIPDGETKTRETYRVILMPASVDVLRGRAERVSGPWVFPSTTSAAGHLTELRTTWDDVLGRAEISNFRFHDLRHHYASTMADAGVPLQVVAKQLGHRDPATTAKYAHLALDAQRHAVDAAAAAMTEAAKGGG